MRPSSLPAPVLVVLSAFCSPSAGLPVAEEGGKLREGRFHALRPRYSVVPIDGGTSSAGQAATTIIETVTPSPKTETATVSAGEATKTVAATQPDISVVSIQPAQPTAPLLTIVKTYTVTDDATYATPTSTDPPPVATPTSPPTINLSSSTSIPAAPSSSSPSSSTPTTEISTATVSATITTSASSASLPSCSTSSAPPSPYTLTISTTSTMSYDDGQWHTTYPAWNGTWASYRRARR